MTTVERILLAVRPSPVPACASVPAGGAWAHVDAVGMSAVQLRTRRMIPPYQGISGVVSGSSFVAPTSTSNSKINYINGITSATGVGVATALRDHQVQGAEARGIPPRGRPV